MKEDDLMECHMQVKLDILQGRLPVHNDLAAELAALALQCKFPKAPDFRLYNNVHVLCIKTGVLALYLSLFFPRRNELP
jgi:hypothetical protein